MEKPKKIHEQIVFDNKYRKIIKKTFQIKNWKTHDFFIAWSSWTNISTMVMPITKESKIIYGKEFRYGPQSFVNNFPFWILEENLEEIENVKKELKEETWYTSNNIEYLWESIMWGYETWIVKYYIAKDCIPWEQKLEDSEYIETKLSTKKEFEKMIRRWEINCPFTLSCWVLWKRFL